MTSLETELKPVPFNLKTVIFDVVYEEGGTAFGTYIEATSAQEALDILRTLGKSVTLSSIIEVPAVTGEVGPRSGRWIENEEIAR